jgi:hypothetical protein
LINFNHNADTIVDSFNLTLEEQGIIDKLFDQLIQDKKSASPLWFIQRVWIDEVLSENAKLFLTFTVGRYYEFIKYQQD